MCVCTCKFPCIPYTDVRLNMNDSVHVELYDYCRSFKYLLIFQDIRERVKEEGKPHAGALSVSLACCLFSGLS